MTVFRYSIPLIEEFTLELPEDSRVLSVQVQGGQPCLWALVDPSRPKSKRRFRLAGTGHPIKDAANLSFVGMFQLRGGSLVSHLFEYRD